MVRKDTIFGEKLKYILVRSYELNYIEMFVVEHIYIRYDVISIILITAILSIEIFYLTKLCSFLGC